MGQDHGILLLHSQSLVFRDFCLNVINFALVINAPTFLICSCFQRNQNLILPMLIATSEIWNNRKRQIRCEVVQRLLFDTTSSCISPMCTCKATINEDERVFVRCQQEVMASCHCSPSSHALGAMPLTHQPTKSLSWCLRCLDLS